MGDFSYGLQTPAFFDTEMGTKAISTELTDAYPSTGPNALRHDWRDVLLAALLVALAIGITGAFSVPTSPWLAPWVAGWLVITVIAGYFFYFQVWRLLRNGDAARGIKRSIWQFPSRRSYLLQFLNLALLMALSGTFSICPNWWSSSSSKDWDTLKVAMPALAGSFFALLLFALIWRRAGSQVDRFFDKAFGMVLAFVLYLVFWIGAYFLYGFVDQRVRIGPAVPWPDQLAAAQAVARRQVPTGELLLTRIFAHRDYAAMPSYNARLDVTFSYEVSANSELAVDIMDTNPDASARSFDYSGGECYVCLTPDREKIDAALATVKISPREAYERSRAAAGDLGKPDSTLATFDLLNVSLNFDGSPYPSSDTFNSLKVPAAWEVSRYVASKHETFWVDSSNGEILKIEEK